MKLSIGVCIFIIPLVIFVTNVLSLTKKQEEIDAALFRFIWTGLKHHYGEKGIRMPTEKKTGGITYIQWGRTRCTAENSKLVYTGYTGGSAYTNTGAAANHLCLPKAPQWGVFDNKDNGGLPFIGGAVYNMHAINVPNTPFDATKYTLHGVPCSVCLARNRFTTLMVPGRKECFEDWHVEYVGYLYAGYREHPAATEYICVDQSPETLQKYQKWSDKRIIFPVRARCNEALPCPPYVEGREMTCVVCSK